MTNVRPHRLSLVTLTAGLLSLAVLTLGMVEAITQPVVFYSADALYDHVYSSDEGLAVRVEQGGMRFTARYFPPEALLVNDARRAERLRDQLAADTTLDARVRTARIDSLARHLETRRAAYAETVSFTITIGAADGADLVYSRLRREGYARYGVWLERLLFGLEEHLTLEVGDVEVPCSGYVMERNYGMAPARTFLVSFPARYDGLDLRAAAPATLVLDEFGLGTGSVALRFSRLDADLRYALAR